MIKLSIAAMILSSRKILMTKLLRRLGEGGRKGGEDLSSSKTRTNHWICLTARSWQVSPPPGQGS